jgi:hypothetical protein
MEGPMAIDKKLIDQGLPALAEHGMLTVDSLPAAS